MPAIRMYTVHAKRPNRHPVNPQFTVMRLFMLSVCLVAFVQLVAASDPPLWPFPEEVHCNATGPVQPVAAPASFSFSATGVTSDILTSAMKRYAKLTFLKEARRVDRLRAARGSAVEAMHVNVRTDNQTLALGMDESYSLTLHGSYVELVANTVFGAIRGLETFSQLVELTSDGGFAMWLCDVVDAPRFSHRGFLLDTSRYFYPTSFIEHILDAMSYSKLNVLHWHITDAESFPPEIARWPRLAGEGAFPPNSFYCPEDKCTFSKDDIAGVVDYARNRGIRVIMEMDVPGHTRSWGLGYSGITAEGCHSEHGFNIDSVPLDPSNETTMQVVKDVYDELTGGGGPVTDDFVHAGGDEVILRCWELVPRIAQWLQEQGLTTYEAEAKIVRSVQDMILANGKTPINWADVFLSKSSNLHPNTVLDVWEQSPSLWAIVSSSSYRAILSAGWYLTMDPSKPSHFKPFYTIEPFSRGDWTPEEKARVIGGEVSKWGCAVNCPNPTTKEMFDGMVWPVAAAPAERLWAPMQRNNATAAFHRYSAHRDRLVLRGVNASRPLM